MWVFPVTVPGGNPVIADPGLSPRLPCTIVKPLLVTVVPARTRKLPAAPRGTGACPQPAGLGFAAGGGDARAVEPMLTAPRFGLPTAVELPCVGPGEAESVRTASTAQTAMAATTF